MSIFGKIFGQKILADNNNISSFRQPLPDFDELHDFKQIVSIFDYSFSSNDKIAQKAAETIHRLFTQVNLLKNRELYETFKYIEINKTDIPKFMKFPLEIRTTLLCIATLNRNGYSRETALDELIEIKGQRVFQFVLFRLADWVFPIREKAVKMIDKYLEDDNTVLFIQNHNLINWMLKVERADLSDLYRKIINSVTSKRLSDTELKKLIEGERLFYYKSLISSQACDSEIIDSLLRDKYYLIRLLLIKHFDKLPDKGRVLSKLLTDKSQKVRQSAILSISDQNVEDYQSTLEILIFDDSASVRSESRRLLSKMGNGDFIELYKENLAKPEHLVGSIVGLSEVGNKEDISIISNYLGSKTIKVKIAALFGIYNLNKDLATEKCYEILESENPVSFKKAGEIILSKQGVDITRLRTIYDLSDNSGKIIILRLINKFGGWSAAGDYLKALVESDDKLAQNAAYFLEAWDKYTMRLGTRQTKEDKEYVLKWFYKAKDLGLKIPENIPFIFGER